MFNVAAFAACEELILTEALIDALTFWTAGYRHVASAYGAGGFTEETLEAFETHGIKRVLIAFDRDAAGDKGAAAVAEQIAARGIGAYQVNFPKGMDANAYALAVKPAPQNPLGALLRAAEWMAGGTGSKRRPEPEVTPALGLDAAAPRPSPLLAAETDTAAAPAPVDDLPEPTLASPIPPGSPPPVAPEMKGPGQDVVIRLGDRSWRVRGLHRNTSAESLMVNLMVRRALNDGDEAFHVDSLDLLGAKTRGAYLAEAAVELGLAPEAIKRDLGHHPRPPQFDLPVHSLGV